MQTAQLAKNQEEMTSWLASEGLDLVCVSRRHYNTASNQINHIVLVINATNRPHILYGSVHLLLGIKNFPSCVSLLKICRSR